MKRAFFVCALLVSILPAMAQEIPDGIRYIKASEEENEKAATYLTKLFNSNLDVNMPRAMGCGPFLWGELVTNNVFPEDVGIPMEFQFPMGDKVQRLVGRVIRWEDQTKLLQTFLRATFQKSGSFAIRKLTPKEMQLYWMMITYDIQEPVFIIDSFGYNLLVDLDEKGEIFFIDNYHGAWK